MAIKVLPKDFVSDADRLRRFEQEAKTLAALNHPNVLTVHDAGVHDGAPYLVSELVEGKTLREEMNGAALPVRKATEYALQIARWITHFCAPVFIFLAGTSAFLYWFSGAICRIGDIAYYAPWGNLAIFYRDFSYSTGLVKLGKLDSDVDALRNAQTTKATIELIKE